MAAKKKSPSKKPVNKSAFVRALPTSMSGADVVKKAKEMGIKISLAYVYGIRSKSQAKKNTRSPSASPSSPTKRGPGRPRKSAAVTGNGYAAEGARTSVGLVAEIERIVERKVTELLRARLGTLFGA